MNSGCIVLIKKIEHANGVALWEDFDKEFHFNTIETICFQYGYMYAPDFLCFLFLKLMRSKENSLMNFFFLLFQLKNT